MDHIEEVFLKAQNIIPWFWKIFIDDIFLYEQKAKRAKKNSLRTTISFSLTLSLLMKNGNRKLMF